MGTIIEQQGDDFFVKSTDVNISIEENSSNGILEGFSMMYTDKQILILSKIPSLDFLDFFRKIELAEQIKIIKDNDILSEIQIEIDTQQQKYSDSIEKEEKRLYYMEKRAFGL